MEVRDIRLDDAGLARLNDAVERAARHGGRQSLVLMDDLAFVVNVRDRRIVTALDGDSRKEGVFTQIDSVVLADDKS
jgi:flagellar operon protein